MWSYGHSLGDKGRSSTPSYQRGTADDLLLIEVSIRIQNPDLYLTDAYCCPRRGPLIRYLLPVLEAPQLL